MADPVMSNEAHLCNLSWPGVQDAAQHAVNLLQGPTGATCLDFVKTIMIGAKAATELADLYRKRVLEACHCVLDDAASDGQAKARRTATEVERSYAAMIARTDVLREQWAEMGIKPLLRKMLRAIRHVEQGRVGEDGRVVRGVVVIPPHIDRDANGKIVGKRAREIGEGEVIELVWPSYFEATIDDGDVAVKTAAAALAGQLVDQEAAIAYVAPYFHVSDPKAMADRIQQAAAKQAALVSGIEAGLPAGETIDGPGGASPFALEADDEEPAHDERPAEGEDVEEPEVEA